MRPRACLGKRLGMSTGRLTIDLNAITENWRALDALSPSTVETAATVKAEGPGTEV